jgi:hypothetical protein
MSDVEGPVGGTTRPVGGSTVAAGEPTADQVVPVAPLRVGTPPAAGVAVVLCAALVVLGVVALRELVVGREVAGTVPVPGDPWLAPLLGSATAVVAGTTAVLVGAAGMVLGVLLVAAAVAGRPPRGVRLVARHPLDVPVDLDLRGVAALAAEAALADDEVETSRASATRRRVTVDVSVDPREPHDEAALVRAVTARVQDRLVDVDPQPVLRVRVHGAVAR